MAVKRVILQKGHVAPREPGHEGATGAQGEQQVVSILVDALAAKLKADKRFSVQVIPGKIPDSVRNVKNVCDIFISFHCDGSTDKQRGGWGIGYPTQQINRAFAVVLSTEIGKFHRSRRLPDNYTRNMSQYYAWNDLDINGPEVLVEHGFSSNPTEKVWMISEKGKFVTAYMDALAVYFELTKDDPDPVDLALRRARLRQWVIASHNLGWTWTKIKATPEWKEYKKLGGT